MLKCISMSTTSQYEELLQSVSVFLQDGTPNGDINIIGKDAGADQFADSF